MAIDINFGPTAPETDKTTLKVGLIPGSKDSRFYFQIVFPSLFSV